MTLEWIVVSLLLASVWIGLGRWFRSPRVWLALALTYAAALGSVGWWHAELRVRLKSRSELAAKTPGLGRPGGYTSSDTCRACHPDEYQSWHRSYHRTMTQLPSRETVRGNFQNV